MSTSIIMLLSALTAESPAVLGIHIRDYDDAPGAPVTEKHTDNGVTNGTSSGTNGTAPPAAPAENV